MKILNWTLVITFIMIFSLVLLTNLSSQDIDFDSSDLDSTSNDVIDTADNEKTDITDTADNNDLELEFSGKKTIEGILEHISLDDDDDKKLAIWTDEDGYVFLESKDKEKDLTAIIGKTIRVKGDARVAEELNMLKVESFEVIADKPVEKSDW